MAGSGGGPAVHWFRKGLRLHDNPALIDAARMAAAANAPLYPIFVLDPWFLHPSRVGVNRVHFLLQSLHSLNSGLRKHKSRLLVLRGKPDAVLLNFIQEYDVRTLTFELDHEPYARERDAEITRLAEAAEVCVRQHCSHTLYDPAVLLSKNGGAPPKTYQSMLSLLQKVGKPPHPVDAPGQGDISSLSQSLLTAAEFSVPSLSELGYCDQATSVIPGGECEALRRLDLLSCMPILIAHTLGGNTVSVLSPQPANHRLLPTALCLLLGDFYLLSFTSFRLLSSAPLDADDDDDRCTDIWQTQSGQLRLKSPRQIRRPGTRRARRHCHRILSSERYLLGCSIIGY